MDLTAGIPEGDTIHVAFDASMCVWQQYERLRIYGARECIKVEGIVLGDPGTLVLPAACLLYSIDDTDTLSMVHVVRRCIETGRPTEVGEHATLTVIHGWDTMRTTLSGLGQLGTFLGIWAATMERQFPEYYPSVTPLMTNPVMETVHFP